MSQGFLVAFDPSTAHSVTDLHAEEVTAVFIIAHPRHLRSPKPPTPPAAIHTGSHGSVAADEYQDNTESLGRPRSISLAKDEPQWLSRHSALGNSCEKLEMMSGIPN